MIEHFETYSRRPFIYYALYAIIILAFGAIFILWQRSSEIQSNNRLVIIILFSLGMISLVMQMILTATNLVKMYITDGELILFSETLVMRNNVFDLKLVRKIEIRATDYRGARTSDGSGNRIEITNSANEIIQCRFVIKSREQKDKLGMILKQWESDGVNIYK